MLRKPDYGRLFFEAETGTNAGNTGTTDASTTGTPPNTGASDAVTFTPEQQKELDRLIGKARQEGRDAEKQVNSTAEQERQAEAQRQAEIDKGNFDKVEADLKGERDGFKSERDTFKSDLDAANVVIAEQVESLKKDLPTELLASFPESGSPLDQLGWLRDRKQVFETAKTAAGVTATNVTRLPQTPKGTNANATDAAYEQMKGRISI